MSETPESLRTEAQRLDRQAAYEFNAGDTAAASRCNNKASDLRRKARLIEPTISAESIQEVISDAVVDVMLTGKAEVGDMTVDFTGFTPTYQNCATCDGGGCGDCV